MQEMVNFFIGKIPAFFSFLSSVEIVSGVTLLGFLGGIFLLYVMISNFLFRAR